MNGWTGQVLRIDLTHHTYEIENPKLDYYKKWIGGRGFNSEVEYRETYRGMDPFDPDNPLMFATGPLTATFAPVSGRTTVSARSPMTCSAYLGTSVHGHGDSNMGGPFGAMMKYAGFDQIIVKGKSDKPVHIFVNNGKVEFRDATHLWGLGITETSLKIQQELNYPPNMQSAVIGPAGEKLVRFACIVSAFGSTAGRTGMGAVMGSKNLKALSVYGTKPVTIAKPEEFAKACWALRERIHNAPSAKRRSIEGTLDLFDAGNAIGINANKNCSTGYMPGIEEAYGGVQYAKNYLFRRKGCWSCPVSCGRYTYIKDGPWAGIHFAGPEMESLCAMGPRLDSLDTAGAAMLSGLADELGIDSISGGGAISWAIEAFEKGYITEKETGGIKLKWDDIPTATKLLKMIANREGFGDILAEGSIRAAEKLGVGMDIVPHCRGLEHISVDPRIALGFSLGYAMSTRGSDHLKNYSVLEFPGRAKATPYQIEEAFEDPKLVKKFWEDFPKEMWTIDTKPKLVDWSEKNKGVADLMGCCAQATGSWGGAGTSREAYYPLFLLATGIDMSWDELFKAAKRVIAIERAHWLREGSGVEDDTHIDRYFKEGVADGPYKGFKLDATQWAWAQQEYYKFKGWDKDGFITPETAKELGIEEIVPDMEKGKKIYFAVKAKKLKNKN